MANTSQRELQSRAEARRRARLQARGVEIDQPDVAPAPAGAPQPTRASFFDRLFPPAAPLPGKADPLAGFGYQGPLRSVVATGYLLTRNPLAWIAMGVAWAVSYFGQIAFADNMIGVVASILSFVVLIAAGWIGWQRPWAYGLAAAVIGFLLYAGFLLLNILRIPTTEPIFNGGQFALYVISWLIMQSIIGVIAGFYGGYLRRRLAEPRQQPNRRRR
jgi:hypothetical protein